MPEIRKLDLMRKFIISYPRWEDWGVIPARGFFQNFTDIAADWFQSSTEVAQLALQANGSAPIGFGADRVRRTYIDGRRTRTRQRNYYLYILQFSGTSSQRADNSEVMDDLVEWIDLMDETEQTPIFGDIAQEEVMWATGGEFTAEWEGTQPASIYRIGLHKISAREYPPIFK